MRFEFRSLFRSFGSWWRTLPARHQSDVPLPFTLSARGTHALITLAIRGAFHVKIRATVAYGRRNMYDESFVELLVHSI